MYTIEQIREAGVRGELSSIDVEHLIKVLQDMDDKYIQDINM